MKSQNCLVSLKRGRLTVKTTITTATLVACCLAISGVLASENSILTELPMAGPETALVKSLQEIAESRMDSALSGIEQLLKTNPNFRLAQLI